MNRDDILQKTIFKRVPGKPVRSQASFFCVNIRFFYQNQIQYLPQNTYKKQGTEIPPPFCIISTEKEVEKEDEETKETKLKGKIFLESDVAAEISSGHVRAIRDLADHIQVCPPVGLDDGISGREAGDVRAAGLGKAVCGAGQFCQSIYGPAVPADHDQYHRDQYPGDRGGNDHIHSVRIGTE